MSTTSVLDSPRNLIDAFLAEQQQLTAVERFSRKHESHALPAQARYYRELIPLTKPGPGEQYAFGVDLDACTGCKACVSACHSLNGLDEDEIWRNVGSLHGGSVADPYQQTVTTACHHCAEPGCLEGCPVMAYEKDPATGIVRHLDDQCIGCEYCLLKCPYDVPKYSKRRGIVRKCDMCYQRLAADEAPACVQACPNEAITIRLVEKKVAIASAMPGVRLLPGAFESSYTKPTTVYTTRKVVPENAHPSDVHRLRLEHPHWPLICMLLLSQLSAGLTLCLAAAVPLGQFASVSPLLAPAAFAALQAGLILSVFHLGRPFKAWRFFLGLRTSWMSREILVFSVFAGALAAAAACAVLGSPAARVLALRFLPAWVVGLSSLAPLLAVTSALLALAAIFCSAMIYVDTHRPFWNAATTFPKFFGTTALLGLSATTALLGWLSMYDPALSPLARGAAAVSLVALVLCGAWEALAFHHSLHHAAHPAHRSARAIWHLLRPLLRWRSGAVAAGWIATALAIHLPSPAAALAASTCGFLLLLSSAIIERYCFFTASDAPRMPGGIAA